MPLIHMQIGAQIAALRKARGMTQEQLAAQLGVSAPAVSKWETDVSPNESYRLPTLNHPVRNIRAGGFPGREVAGFVAFSCIFQFGLCIIFSAQMLTTAVTKSTSSRSRAT